MGKSFLLKHATANLGYETMPKCNEMQTYGSSAMHVNWFHTILPKTTQLEPKKRLLEKRKNIETKLRIVGFQDSFGVCTPPKINMEPKNEPIEKENHLPFTSIFWFHPFFEKKTGFLSASQTCVLKHRRCLTLVCFINPELIL